MPPTVFADTFFWLALARTRDPWHTAAVGWRRTNSATRIVTSDEVLTEFLNAMSRGGAANRAHAAVAVHDLRSDAQVDVLPQTRADFDAALALYESRLDKEYSLVDCRSMVAMRTLGILEVLSNDRHFTQEGFTVVFP